jgi:hypothetical protein
VTVAETIDAFAPPLSRFSALNALTVKDDDDARWLLGFQFRPESCASNNGGILAADCFGKTSAMSTHAAKGVENGTGFLVYWRDDCSTFGYEASEYEGRALRGLASVESYHFALELQAGAITGPTGSAGVAEPNTPLADASATIVTSASSTPLNALACLENAIAKQTKNRRGLVFMRPQLLVLLASAYAIQLQGNTWVTPMGNIVVPDGAFTGANPAGTALSGNQFMYGTSWMEVRRGATSTFGGPNPTGVDRSVNTVTTYAVRPYMWQWDGCFLGAAEVNVAVCG